MEQITISVVTCPDTGTLLASWDDPRGFGGLTTQAEKLSDLENNIREAIAVHFEPEDLPKQVRLRGWLLDIPRSEPRWKRRP